MYGAILSLVVVAAAGVTVYYVVSRNKNHQTGRPPTPKPTPRSVESQEPRGRLPWSTGDVGLWDN